MMKTRPSEGRYTDTVSQPSPLKSPAIGMSPGLPKKNERSAMPWSLVLRR